MRFYNERLTTLYQGDDLWLWSNDVVGFKPRRARILSGYFADTFSGTGADGRKTAFAPCLGYSPMLPDAIAAAAGGALALAGFPPAAAVAAAAATVFAGVVGSSDIVMSTRTKIGQNRAVGSHEYGHFLFCSLLNDFSGTFDDPVGDLVTSTIGSSSLDSPVRYINEAMADYFTGQVAGAADYAWPNNASVRTNMVSSPPPGSTLCIAPSGPCFDANIAGNPSNPNDPVGVGRIATLIHDVFDGHNQRFGPFPGDADLWAPNAGSGPLRISSGQGFANADSHLERVALTSDALTFLARRISFRDRVNEVPFYASLNDTMMDRGVSWCDRCRVFALHSTVRPDAPTISDLFRACLADPLLAETLREPPERDLRLDAASCTPCPTGFTSDSAGVCVPCPAPRRVVGNQCVECPADVTRDGASLVDEGFNAGLVVPGDTCPETFWIEITRPSLVFERGPLALSVLGGLSGATQRDTCERELTLLSEKYSSTSYQQYPALIGRGEFRACDGSGADFGCPDCRGLPVSRSFAAPDLHGAVRIRIGTPRDADHRLDIRLNFPQPPIK